VATPTLSAGIRQIEDELGITIIHQPNSQVDFTPEGEIVVSWAQKTLGAIEAMMQEFGVQP
jgi:DNA-binding transcriptional LysR family regulator